MLMQAATHSSSVGRTILAYGMLTARARHCTVRPISKPWPEAFELHEAIDCCAMTRRMAVAKQS
jgi:hypothetical protein